MTQPPQGNDPWPHGGRQPPGQPGYGPPPYGGPPPKQPTGLIIGIVVATLLLIGGGVVGLVFLLQGDDDNESSGSVTDDSTSVVPQSPVVPPVSSLEPPVSSLEPPVSSLEPPHIPDDGEAYCARIRANNASGEFDDVAPDEVDDLRAELLILRQLAPAELQDDYQVLIDAVNGEQVDPSTALQNVEAYHASGCSGTATGG